jgi:RNA polymerase sigma factor (sigma-70 family)
MTQVELPEPTQKEEVVSTEQIWSTFSQPLRAFLRSRVADEETAEDLLQDVFVKIHEHAGTLRDHKRIESWIYQVTRHALIDHYRRRKTSVPIEDVETELPLEDLPEEDIRAQLLPSLMEWRTRFPNPIVKHFCSLITRGFLRKRSPSVLGSRSQEPNHVSSVLVTNSNNACWIVVTSSLIGWGV